MGVHTATEANRVNGNGSSHAKGERYEAISECKRCGESWTFMRYPRNPRPEFDVCAECAAEAALKWLAELES